MENAVNWLSWGMAGFGFLLVSASVCARAMEKARTRPGIDRLRYRISTLLIFAFGVIAIGRKLPTLLGAPFPVVMICDVLSFVPMLAIVTGVIAALRPKST
ncbi:MULTISPECIES: hypothetical protein [Streptomyces]|uniref:hypothetical protein n=1 Tax=unclassified Streptomyces TaxID=2593676 RepID=UPI0029A943C9|nr:MULTISPECIES: hypothetical protein [unclassified Streptomyces]MDX3767520.1 hypothetical protein [Streptomyces sp. AK08-01B]MDX3820432.1 hypothetical protein [Streptomyces sp. AK08-01A]